MAEKRQEEPAHNIVCPLCLDVFDEASMLTCSHTFCTSCLERYDATHRNLDHMVCPLCRKVTKLDARRVRGLPANTIINTLVEEYYSTQGGMTSVLEGRPKCTACDLQVNPVSFCYECGNYMCAKCDHGHRQLTSFFKGHQVVSMKDVITGNASIGDIPLKCSMHKHENKDLFCDDCSTFMCLKCMVVSHRDHKIKNQLDVQKDMQKKVNDIMMRSDEKKVEYERHIQIIETKRKDIHIAIKELQGSIREASNIKIDKLKENERVLLAETHLLQLTCDKELDSLKDHDRQTIKAISNSVNLVDNDRLGWLEGDSLAAHSLIYNELESLLKERVDERSVRNLVARTNAMQFNQAGDTLLELGVVSWAGPSLGIEKAVELPCQMNGITPLSEGAVIVGYTTTGKRGADRVDIKGNVQGCTQSEGYYLDIALQKDSSLVVSWDRNSLKFYTGKNWTKMSTRIISNGSGLDHPFISISPRDEIIAANRSDRIQIYNPTGSRNCSISTKETPMQARATMKGLIVASTCDARPNYNNVRVYRRDGLCGDPVIGEKWEYLYPAVDEEDRVFVASVNRAAGLIRITVYRIEGLQLKKVGESDQLNLAIGHSWCYLVSLSRSRLAFACDKKVYFLSV